MKYDLVTTLTLLKASMNGALPPLTPLTERALKFFDPAFVPGMGILAEDPEKGLRCPLRDCGSWRQRLNVHMKSHRRTGDWLRRELGLSPRAALITDALRATLSANTKRQREMGRAHNLTAAEIRMGQRSRRRGAGALGDRRRAISTRNLIGRCDAQLAHRLLDLQHRLGRSPTHADVSEHYGPALASYLEKLDGSFNATKARLGFATIKCRGVRWTLDAVLPSLLEWHRRHGALPSCRQVYNPNRLPLLPSYHTIMRALGADSWPEAMRRAATLLNIHGGRYGLPVKQVTA